MTTTRTFIARPHEIPRLLDGSQTRVTRVIRWPDRRYDYQPCKRPKLWGPQCDDDIWPFFDMAYPTDTAPTGVRCLFGPIGTALVVKETFRQVSGFWHLDDSQNKGRPIEFRAEGEHPTGLSDISWRSPVTMPAWASRLTLEVVSVEAMRVQDITRELIEATWFDDILGYDWHRPDCRVLTPVFNNEGVCVSPGGCSCGDFYVEESWPFFWDADNPAHPWDSNPWIFTAEVKERP